MSTNNTVRDDLRSKRTSIVTQDKIELADLITADLVRNGISIEDVSIISDTSLLTLGFNTILDDALVSVSNISRESSLLSAINLSSLYNQLAQHTNEVSLCKPSTTEMFVKIPLPTIQKLGRIVQANTYELTYSNKNIAVLDGLEFIPVIETHYIRLTLTNTRHDVNVFYKNSDGVKVNIPTQTLIEGDHYVVGFKAEFMQVTINSVEKIFSDPQLEKFVINNDYPIYDFKLYYRATQADKWKEIGKRQYFTRGTSNFLEYKIYANNKVSIEHKYTTGGFLPEKGGILRVDLYGTTGQNIKTEAGAELKQCDPVDLVVEYLPVGEYFESVGGRLASDNKETIRNTVIALKGARKRIDTEADLGIFLKAYEGSSQFKPKLVVNHVKSRIFNIYTVLSFTQTVGTTSRTFTIPTSSGTVSIALTSLDKRNVEGYEWFTFASNALIKSGQDSLTEYYVFEGNDIKPPSPVPEGEYYYVSPFIYSYNEMNNFTRVFMDAQYDEPYVTYSEYEGEHNDILSRFVNTTLRMNDYVDENNMRQFYVSTQIRADNEEYEIDEHNFKCRLRLYDMEDKPIYIYGTVESLNKENKYELTFPMSCDRKIFDIYTDIYFTDEITRKTASATVNVNQHAVLELYTIKSHEDPITGDIVYETPIKVIEYGTDLKLFDEVTPRLALQNNMNYSGQMDFLLMPLVAYDFYQRSQNKEQIIKELKSIFSFIKTEITDVTQQDKEIDMFSKVGYTADDRAETLFNVAFKFAKTYGRSRFLNVGNHKTIPITNLQFKPTFFLEKLDQEFDESAISNSLNLDLIEHDYDMADYHVNVLIKDVYTNASDSVNKLQFVNFDNYPSDYHLIRRNENDMKNNDVPEVLSVAPKWNEELEIYEYDVTYNDF